MALRGVVVLLGAIVAFFVSPAASVFGGYPIEISNAPHYASISANTNVKPQYFANGAIVSRWCILTTASILRGKQPKDLVVRVGSSTADKDGEELKVLQIGSHPNPDLYDIAFLKLTAAMTSQNIRPIGFGDRPKANEVAEVSSLGKSENGYSAPKLVNARMKVVPVCECARAAGNATTKADPALLYLTNAPANGTCDRDDGAPLVFRGYLAGLASNKRVGCRDQRKESAFVDISDRAVQDFIRGCL